LLIPPFKLLSLSATGRQTDATTLTLSDNDRSNPIVKKRLTAKKALSIVDLANVAGGTATPADGKNADDADEATKKNKGSKLAGVLAKQAWEVTRQGSARGRCLVFCNARKDATAVAGELRTLATSASATKPTVELFVGARRVLERTMVAKWLVDHGFVEQEDGTRAEPQAPTFLVATSAGEVGVDMDADHMVCDVVAWERMVQRLGRVNRRGDGEAKVVVVVDGEPSPSDGTTKALEKREASNAAKRQLDELTKKLNAVQGAKVSIPKGQKKSADAKATEEKRKQEEKELKKSISAQKNRIKAFKDADAKVVARHEAEVAKYRALRKLLDAVGPGGSLSPDALLRLRQRQELADAQCAATTVEPLRPELTRAVVDAWSMTSLDEHPGRPDVDPWLRGFRPSDRPQTTGTKCASSSTTSVSTPKSPA
jgi:CRISPR-associated endonuclease/helicase Cas3